MAEVYCPNQNLPSSWQRILLSLFMAFGCTLPPGNRGCIFFGEHGYQTLNPDWPGDGATVEASRANKNDR
jgi:hypothetical protein